MPRTRAKPRTKTKHLIQRKKSRRKQKFRLKSTAQKQKLLTRKKKKIRIRHFLLLSFPLLLLPPPLLPPHPPPPLLPPLRQLFSIPDKCPKGFPILHEPLLEPLLEQPLTITKGRSFSLRKMILRESFFIYLRLPDVAFILKWLSCFCIIFAVICFLL